MVPNGTERQSSMVLLNALKCNSVELLGLKGLTCWLASVNLSAVSLVVIRHCVSADKPLLPVRAPGT